MTKLGCDGIWRPGVDPRTRQRLRGWAFTPIAPAVDACLLSLFNRREPPPWVSKLFNVLRAGGPTGQWNTLDDEDFCDALNWCAKDPEVRVPALETAYVTANANTTSAQQRNRGHRVAGERAVREVMLGHA